MARLKTMAIRAIRETWLAFSEATSSLMRGEAAAVPPSTARKPLVMATAILSSVYGTTVPLRLMMRSSPGAVAVMALERVPSDIRAQGGVARMSDPKLIKAIQKAVSIPASFPHLRDRISCRASRLCISVARLVSFPLTTR
jgi:hypothetical protein